MILQLTKPFAKNMVAGLKTARKVSVRNVVKPESSMKSAVQSVKKKEESKNLLIVSSISKSIIANFSCVMKYT